MKVGILTYHFGANYGAVLQCYALQTAIRTLGHDVQVIDFSPLRKAPPLWKGWQLHRKGFSQVIPRIIQLRHGKALLREFDRFRAEHLSMSPPVRSLDALKGIAPHFDAIVTGSDQIWNFRCSPAYFLDLGPAYQGRRISYAACATQREQPMDRIEQVGKWIRNYDFISVRDDFTKEAVFHASGREAGVTCDPTMLMEPGWPFPNRATPKDEILVYRLGEDPHGHTAAALTAVRKHLGNLPARGIVAAAFNPVQLPECDYLEFDVSPLRWAECIRNCRILVTDSYHGVLFALRYGLPFLIVCAVPERAPRMYDLAERLALQDRIITGAFKPDVGSAALLTPHALTSGVNAWIRQSQEYLATSLA